MLLNKEWVNSEIKEEIKRYLETNENDSTANAKSVGHSKSSPKREVYSVIDVTQEIKNLNIQSNLTLKGTWKRKTKPKVSSRKEIIKIRAEINKIE